MRPTWLHFVACFICSNGLLFDAVSMADEKSDMDTRMMECAATTETDKLGECLSAKGAPAVSATDSEAEVHAAVVKCMDDGVTGTTEIARCVNTRLVETKAQPADVTDAQVQEAARLCSKHYTETDQLAVCVQTVLHRTGYANPK